MQRWSWVLVLLLTSATASTSASPSWDPQLSKAVDAEIHATLMTLKLTPAGRAADHVLIRRLYLDLLGRTPTLEELEAGLQKTAKGQHHDLIDELLIHPEMSVYWRRVLHNWLNGSLRESRPGEQEHLELLQKSLEKNVPWDQIARTLLLPDEKGADPGAAYFLTSRLQENDKQVRLDNVTTAVASGLFGVQLQCAKCHDHPVVPEWKQDHYYGLASFFVRAQTARQGNRSTVRDKGNEEVKFVTTAREEKIAKLMFLDSKVLASKDASRRKLLADYAIGPGNPFFSRALVNRAWKQLMGRGLVEPVDQMNSANDPTHPKLLNLLASDFAKNGFDLRRLLAGILHSDAYLRSSVWNGESDYPAKETYAVFNLRPLSGYQLAHSLALSSGYLKTLQKKYEREKKKRKLSAVTLTVTRTLFEREREHQAFLARFRSASDEAEASVSGALFLTYNPVMEKLFQRTPDSLSDRLSKIKNDTEVVNLACRTLLCRLPTPAESKAMQEYLQSTADRRQASRDLLWALLSSAGYRFNH